MNNDRMYRLDGGDKPPQPWGPGDPKPGDKPPDENKKDEPYSEPKSSA